MRPVQRLLAGVLTTAGLAVSAAPAMADGRSGGAFVDDSGNPTAEASEVVSSGGGGSGGANPADCSWQVLNADDTAMPMYDVDGTRVYSPTGRWLQRICDGEVVAVGGRFAVPESLPGPDPAVLARQALESVAIPEPAMATSPRSDRSLYARVPTWLWVEPGWWRPYSVTAAVGGVSSTVVATPVRAIWTMGDGGRSVCSGPGTEWRPGLGEDVSDCVYTYVNSSAGQPGGTFTMTLTVELAISWSSTTGAGGSLPPLVRSTSRTVTVGEIQAIETS